jgi:hypothetical protein
MEISPETATALGEKLATLDLSEAEGALLTHLLREPSEVEGFGNFYDEVEIHFRANVLGPLPARWKPEAEGYLKITMENN